MAIGGTCVKDLSRGRAGDGEVDLLCANVCERKRLLEGCHNDALKDNGALARSWRCFVMICDDEDDFFQQCSDEILERIRI